MAGIRGRDLAGMGGFLTPVALSGATAAPAEGQPFMHRLFGIPTAVGFRGRWNAIAPFLLAVLEAIRRLAEGRA